MTKCHVDHRNSSYNSLRQFLPIQLSLLFDYSHDTMVGVSEQVSGVSGIKLGVKHNPTKLPAPANFNQRLPYPTVSYTTYNESPSAFRLRALQHIGPWKATDHSRSAIQGVYKVPAYLTAVYVGACLDTIS